MWVSVSAPSWSTDGDTGPSGDFNRILRVLRELTRGVKHDRDIEPIAGASNTAGHSQHHALIQLA